MFKVMFANSAETVQKKKKKASGVTRSEIFVNRMGEKSTILINIG